MGGSFNKKGAALVAILVVILAVVAVLGTIFFYRHLAVAPTLPPGSAGVVAPPAVSWLAPQSGPIGTVVIIHGGGFGSKNTIEMNNLVGDSMKDVTSTDGDTLQFTVPQTLGPNCAANQMCPQFLLMVIASTSYKISVITGSTTQDVGTFTVK